ncbi:hypothetical protein [Granulicella mallensis]|uniref:Uncharacterized protein n=1 Tax=Granulicella mallensis TaxID=940614 RepID=A0A7W7ZR27_9BACT|nr:hypothetical protein [Granulicella mallensis]MBB5063731.1 hypothetical protein [Granulicella mallensis]
MKKWEQGMIVVALMFLFGASGLAVSQGIPSQRHGGLVLKDLPIPKGARVIGLEVHLAAGAFDSLAEIPVGWHVVVDNDPSWQANFEAHASAGAEGLDESTVQNLWLEVIKNEVGDRKFIASGWVILTSNTEKERRIPLSSYNFEFVERYPRHRLHDPDAPGHWR